MNSKSPIRMLISLHKGYGMGDAVQMSSVLRHFRKYRPNYRFDFQAQMNQECIGEGIAENTLRYGSLGPTPNYDAEILITLYDTWHWFTDRPNTRVTSCLKQHFGIEWDRECAKYEINVSPGMTWFAKNIVESTVPFYLHDTPIVALHYQGTSLPQNKDLTDEQAINILTTIRRLGFVPLLIDWKAKSVIKEVLDDRGVHIYSVRPRGNEGSWYGHDSSWGGNPHLNAAIINRCVAFIGIDSGPAKCASATEVPTLVIWTKHHPAQFHDPASNTTHLVPRDFHSLDPVNQNKGVIKWFDENYKCRFYDKNPNSMEYEVETWLERTLL